MLMCVFRCRQNWRRDFGSGRRRVTWALVNDGVHCSLKAARSLRYPSWTNPAPKISRPQRHTPSRPATSLQFEDGSTALAFMSRVAPLNRRAWLSLLIRSEESHVGLPKLQAITYMYFFLLTVFHTSFTLLNIFHLTGKQRGHNFSRLLC